MEVVQRCFYSDTPLGYITLMDITKAPGWTQRGPQQTRRELRSCVSQYHHKLVLFTQQHSPFSRCNKGMASSSTKGHGVAGFQPNVHHSPDQYLTWKRQTDNLRDLEAEQHRQLVL